MHYTFHMSTSELLSLIDGELAHLKQARALIAVNAAATSKKRPGRPSKAAAVAFPAASKPQKKRKMSSEGRARIVAAQKARWDAQKRATK
jgi:hypothetical protein